MKLIKIYATLLVIFLSLNAYSQVGVIELNNGELFEVADDRFYVDKEELRYYKETVTDKGFSLYGIRSGKQKQEYVDKTGAVDVNDIKIISKNVNSH